MASDAELVKGFFDAAFAPVKEVFLRLLGPASDQLGGIIADPIRAYRFRQSIRLLEKVKQTCEKTGFQPKAVPLKTLLPILENASLEDDEGLHDKWANLLANAATADTPDVYTSFSEILRQLSATDARFLEALFTASLKFSHTITRGGIHRMGIGKLPEVFEVYRGLFPEDAKPEDLAMGCYVAINNFGRLRLIDDDPEEGEPFWLTSMGVFFLSACQRPKTKS